jgi:hypothetical protein
VTRQEHLKFCLTCTLRQNDFKQGVVCSRTQQIADFEDHCQYYEVDEEAKVYEQYKAITQASFDTEGDPLDYKKNKENGGLIMAISGAVMFFSFFVFAGIVILPLGAFVYGLIVYNRGREQEKVYRELEKK